MIITRTPFRISFFGGGTDFPGWYREYGGAVLSTSIDKYCYIHCRRMPPFFDYRHKIIFISKQETFNDIDEVKHPAVREVYRFMQVREGLVMQHDADLPPLSGLGSSSAFSVGLLNALYGLRGKMVTKRQLATDAIYVEQEMIGEAVGSQDQMASAFGGLNRISFSSASIEVNPVIIARDKMEYLQNHLMLFFTGYSRFSVTIEEDKLKNLASRREELTAMHQLVDEALSILDGDLSGYDDFGRLLGETWRLKKRLSAKVSTDSIDTLYEKGLAAGALGGKILGAGGGGFILFYVHPEKRAALKAALAPLYDVPFRFDFLGSQVIYYAIF